MVILFGSYAKENAREYSDIDVAVVVDQLKDNLSGITNKVVSIETGNRLSDRASTNRKR